MTAKISVRSRVRQLDLILLGTLFCASLLFSLFLHTCTFHFSSPEASFISVSSKQLFDLWPFLSGLRLIERYADNENFVHLWPPTRKQICASTIVPIWKTHLNKVDLSKGESAQTLSLLPINYPKEVGFTGMSRLMFLGCKTWLR